MGSSIHLDKDKALQLRISFRLFVVISFLLLSAGSSIAQLTSNTKPVVIFVTLDGFPARALEDPRLPMPTLRALAASGAVAEGIRPINPTVTWPNHTALITGVNASKHQVMANGLIQFPADGGAPEVEPWVDKEKLVHARTLYEAAAEKGLTTGQVDWVAIYGAKGVQWQFGEKPDVRDSIPQELIADGLLTREQVEQFGENSSPAWRDEIWTDAAVDIIEKHTPNLLLLHLLETDSIQHEYAPFSAAAFASYAYADHCLQRVVEAARRAGILDRTTFVIAADHGFATYTHSIYPNTALLKLGLLHKQGNQYVGQVWVKAEGGAASLYIRDARLRAEWMPKLKAYFSGVPGVAHVYTNAEAQSLGLPSDAVSDQAPQLYLTASPDYAFEDTVAEELVSTHVARGQHGYLNTMPEMQALFVASGAAIKPGIRLGAITNLQVAPTVALILGVQLPDAVEPPLKEMLR